MEKVESVLSYIKKNISVLILIPTVFGGFWQLLELVSVDVSFVRFFSITQAVSDGLIILIILTLSGLFYYLIFIKFFSLSVFKNNIKDNLVDAKSENIRYIFSLIFAIFCLVAIVSIFYFGKLTPLKMGLSIYLFVLFIKFTFDFIQEKFFNNQSLKSFYFILIVIVPMLLFNINTFLKAIHNLFLPNNFKNIEYLECYTSKKKKDFELLYFNDKYVFIKDIKSKQIEIINFEEMLNKDNCK